MEPFLGILLDQQPKPAHSQLRIVFQNLYNQMTNPIEGFSFATVDRHALPALQDGFSREYKKSWIDFFHLHLKQYEPSKLESVFQTVMKKLASILSRQCGIQYEFGPEFMEYTAQKAAGTLKQTHLKPLSEIFLSEQLHQIPVNNKIGENYFGEMTVQLRKKGSAFLKTISINRV